MDRLTSELIRFGALAPSWETYYFDANICLFFLFTIFSDIIDSRVLSISPVLYINISEIELAKLAKLFNGTFFAQSIGRS